MLGPLVDPPRLPSIPGEAPAMVPPTGLHDRLADRQVSEPIRPGSDGCVIRPITGRRSDPQGMELSTPLTRSWPSERGRRRLPRGLSSSDRSWSKDWCRQAITPEKGRHGPAFRFLEASPRPTMSAAETRSASQIRKRVSTVGDFRFRSGSLIYGRRARTGTRAVPGSARPVGAPFTAPDRSWAGVR
jgi:hypothetical protein